MPKFKEVAMKQLYVCEKCGSQYETWDEAFRCEESHCFVQSVDRSDLSREDGDALYFKANPYKPGEVLPSIIPVKFRVKDENGNTVLDENNQWVYESAFYALVKPTKEQKDLLKAINISMTARRKEDFEEAEKWRAEWEAKQAAKQSDKEEE